MSSAREDKGNVFPIKILLPHRDYYVRRAVMGESARADGPRPLAAVMMVINNIPREETRWRLVLPIHDFQWARTFLVRTLRTL